ncbi:MAG: hypothetical protein WCG26_12795 [Chloroflexales bacterium]
MRKLPQRLADDEPSLAPAEASWVFSMLADGLAFPPPKSSVEPHERPEPTAHHGRLLGALGVLALLIALLVGVQLT